MLKKSLLISLLLSLFTVTVAQAGWHELSQSSRNQAIINTACRDLNKKVGLSCKEWVQKVVKNASGGAVAVPQTVDPPGYYWYCSRYAVGKTGRIENAKPGEIVQMDLTNYVNPHTAIILSVSTKGVTFIECNWCDPPCHIVSIRYVDFATFYKQVVNFSIYCIL